MNSPHRTPKVFLSYSRKDLGFVQQLASDLRTAGLDVWYDLSRLEGGVRWRIEIENAIRESQYVIVVLSPDSAGSEWVEEETLFARKLKRKIIPLYYRPCDLPLGFQTLHYIDVQGGNYESNFAEILHGLNVKPVSAQTSSTSGSKGRARKHREKTGRTKAEREPELRKPRFLFSSRSGFILFGIVGVASVLYWLSSFVSLESAARIPIATDSAPSEPVVAYESPVPTTEPSDPTGPAMSSGSPGPTAGTGAPITVAGTNAAPSAGTSGIIFDNGTWWVEISSVPPVNLDMSVYLNGNHQGATSLIKIGHKQRGSPAWQEFVVIYSTGSIRIIPYYQTYGASFVLGPAYWKENGAYSHNVQISQIHLDTSRVAFGGPIQMTILARDYLSSSWPDYHLDITYTIELPDPGVTAVEMYVQEEFTVANAFSLDPIRQSAHEGFKWIQLSTMYIDEETHISDGIGYLSQDGSTLTTDFAEAGCDTFAFMNPDALFADKPWVEVRHSDDQGWQGNTPNVLVSMDSMNKADKIVPQGYISCSNDPNDDNVVVWLNLESSSLHFNQGDRNAIEFTLAVQDNPILPLENTMEGMSPTEVNSGN